MFDFINWLIHFQEYFPESGHLLIIQTHDRIEGQNGNNLPEKRSSLLSFVLSVQQTKDAFERSLWSGQPLFQCIKQ